MERPLKKDFTLSSSFGGLFSSLRPFNSIKDFDSTGLVLFDWDEYIKAIDKYVNELEKQIEKLKHETLGKKTKNPET